MDGLGPATPFARIVADSLVGTSFTILDVGCSAGIDPVWRLFGNRLRAFGFDPNVNEIARLAAAETLPGVSYIPAFVGLQADDPAIARFKAQDYWSRNPWGRLSVARVLERQASTLEKECDEVKTRLNLWNQVTLADANAPVILSEFLRDKRVDSVDFIKIDVDGPDFLILRSLVPLMAEMKVLGVGIEVNFFGSDDPDVHTFHNVDRLMRSSGFDLFALSMRTYSMAALPAPFMYSMPAQSQWGRPVQGDAIYLRDAPAPENIQWAEAAGVHKLAKLAALFSLVGQPDSAAEVLQRFGKGIATFLDVPSALDTLVKQHGAEGIAYRDYLSEFEVNSDRFYPARHVRMSAEDRIDPTLSDSDARAAAAEMKATRAEVKAATEQQARQAAEADAQAARSDVTRLNQEIVYLRGSTSWKLTAPLRAMVTAMRWR